MAWGVVIIGFPVAGYIMAAGIRRMCQPREIRSRLSDPCPWDDPRPAQLLKFPPHISGDSQ